MDFLFSSVQLHYAINLKKFLSLFLIMDAEAYADTGPVILLFLSQKEKLNKLFLDF